MIQRKKRKAEEVNASSMADIAFLLLIFFLVTTTIVNEKGINFVLPPKQDAPQDVNIKDKNLLKVLVNSQDKILIEDELYSASHLEKIREKAIKFITRGADSPQKAIVSYRTDRGTTYKIYIAVLNELKGAYHQLRADHMGVTKEEYLKYDEGSEEMSKVVKTRFDKAKKAYPMQLSLAEPSEFGS